MLARQVSSGAALLQAPEPAPDDASPAESPPVTNMPPPQYTHPPKSFERTMASSAPPTPAGVASTRFEQQQRAVPPVQRAPPPHHTAERARSMARARANLAHHLHDVAGLSRAGLTKGLDEFTAFLQKAKTDLEVLGTTEMNMDDKIIDNYLLCEDAFIQCATRSCAKFVASWVAVAARIHGAHTAKHMRASLCLQSGIHFSSAQPIRPGGAVSGGQARSVHGSRLVLTCCHAPAGTHSHTPRAAAARPRP